MGYHIYAVYACVHTTVELLPMGGVPTNQVLPSTLIAAASRPCSSVCSPAVMCMLSGASLTLTCRSVQVVPAHKGTTKTTLIKRVGCTFMIKAGTLRHTGMSREQARLLPCLHCSFGQQERRLCVA